ncbi:MAG: DUF429 domain-containing protein, partial [Candidatus Woesearchaeota archaeon]
ANYSFMFFVGIDLAWSEKNKSGVAILKGDENMAELVSADVISSDNEIIDFIKKTLKNNNALIAIDAPLIIPNNEGRRDAEALVGYLFRKYHAGAHPSNRKRLSQWSGKIRGEELSKKLEKEGFIHDPSIKQFEKSRKFFEVYPHPSMVVLFEMDKILEYKSKPHRDYAFRWDEFEKYRMHLKGLANAKPALQLPEKLFQQSMSSLKAKKLKDYEDLLDSVFCAYIGYYCWAKPGKCMVLGDMKQGYIMTPVFDFMKRQLAEKHAQKELSSF